MSRSSISDKNINEKSYISEYLSEIGRKGGLKGGRARAEKLSAEQKSEIAKKAAIARWKSSRRGEND